MSEAPTRIAVIVPSRLDHLDLLQRVAEAVGQLAGFDEDAQLDMGLAVREGAINAMKHGNRLDASLSVEIVFQADADGLRVAVSDRGHGFDPTGVPDPTAPENLLRSHGRGLLLIRSLVDEVQFVQTEHGMQLVLIKHRSALPSSAAQNAR
ncbi:MAG: ATP-binding protein [Acidobacteria bacterium]|nr:ATP-binding protein [Acidobacteriota bacterium]